MAPDGGIITTPSGRRTYAPDGVIEDRERHETTETYAQQISATTNLALSDVTTKASEGQDYFDKDGHEAIEDPIERKGSESSEDDVFEPINAGDEEVLRRLASQLSRNQSYHSQARRSSTAGSEGLERMDTLAGLDVHDPVFDPNSPKFDLYKYLRMFMKLMEQDEIKLKRASVVMKNVNVRGSGSALNLQPTVGDMFTSLIRKDTYKLGHKSTKHILRNVNGLMKSGELLIVLGRPGSGCSTFLKTICGEMHGLELDKDSVVHYDGISQKQMMKEFKGM
jgi:ATP-binding cassette, subfamily G (WHITE), member 2, PDR